MDFIDYYKALGVAPDASADEIKRTFRKSARKYHPDINTDPDAEQKFKSINEAYEVLKDPEKRAAYDALRNGPAPGQGDFEPPPGWNSNFNFSDTAPGADDGFSDFFENLFRRGAHPSERAYDARGSDSHARLQIDIEDAYLGASRTLSMRVPAIQADGRVAMQERNISVRIPAGVTEGQTIRLAGQGAPSPSGGTAGDLFLEVSFAPHKLYRVEGKDIHLDLPITPWEAALGGQIVMPTPGGKVDLRIPPNTRSGQKMRLKGKGLPGHPAGDIYAHMEIVNPKVTTDKARALFEQMAREMPFDPRATLGG